MYGQVFGSTNVVFDGGTVGETILGGGWGDDDLNNGYSPDNGRVGSANVTINSNKDKIPFVYGNGFCSSVTNDINITINGGSIISAYGVYSDQYYALQAGGNVNMKLNGGKICSVGLVVNDRMEQHTIGGKASITVLPDIDATDLSDISSGNPKAGVLKDATFTFKDCGSVDSPFEIPYNLQGFTSIELDHSYVKSTINTFPRRNTAIFLDLNKSNTLLGEGWSKPVKIAPFSKDIVTMLEEMKTLFVIKDAAKLPDGEVFSVDPDNLRDYGFFRIGDTYRVMLGVAGNNFLSSVTTDAGITNGTLSVSWKDTKLFSGDKVPYRDIDKESIQSLLTLEVQPNEGYRLKEGSLKVYKTGDKSALVSLTDNQFILPDYDVTITAEFEQILYQITILSMENGSITASPGMEAAKGVEVNLTLSPASGYRLKEGSLKVYKTGDESTTVALSSNSFSMPDYDVTVTATFEGIPVPPPTPPTPPSPVYYTVTLPAVEGTTTDPTAGDYDVEAWDNFRFNLTLDADYDKSTPVVTTDRGEIIKPRESDGAYIVKYVRQPIAIIISGVVKNDPTANTEIQSGVRVWTSNHQLFIRTDKPENVAIYTFSGQLKKTFRSAGGDESVSLSAGSYIVCIGDKRFKIIL